MTLLLNLYAVGVFMSFTLSQAGMVRHWWKLRAVNKDWKRSIVINGLAAITTLLVAVIISATKFFDGAWIVVILIPAIVIMLELIHRHYTRVEHERTSEIPIRPADIHHRLVVPVAALDAVAKQAVSYARSVSADVVAIHISSHRRKADQNTVSRISQYSTIGSITILRFLPLKAADQVLGVLCLRIQHPVSWFASIERMQQEQEASTSRMDIFWAFLEETSSILERAYLRKTTESSTK